MDVRAFRSPIAKFALALWIGCFQWLLAIPVALSLPLLVRGPRNRAHACVALLLFALGWVGSSAQRVFDPVLSTPITSKWTCTRVTKKNSTVPLLRCTNAYGNTYTARESITPPLQMPFVGTLWPFHSPSWRLYNHSRGVHGTIRSSLPHSRDGGHEPQNDSESSSALWAFLDFNFTGSVPGLLFALISGHKDELNPTLRLQLTHAGLAHLMAVSGYHVGLVSFPFLLLLRHRRTSLRMVGFAGLSGTWFFVAFCGFPTSAVRAGLMLTGFGVSQLTRLDLSAMHLMSLAAWGMLIYNPMWARELGMQLSFVAVYSIVLGIEMLKVGEKLHPILAYAIVPITAQLGTGFITWPAFGLFPAFFLFFNLLASPIMAVLGASLAGTMGMEFVLGCGDAARVGCRSIDKAVNGLLNGLASLYSPSWTWDLRAVDDVFLWAISMSFLVGGTLVVAKRVEMRLFLKGFCAFSLGLIPWVGWQMSHRLAVSYRHGPILEASTSLGRSIAMDSRDSTWLSRNREKFGVAQLTHVELWPHPLATHSNQTWAFTPSRDAGLGQIESRPFAWKRLDGSTVLFNYGGDTVHLKQWDRPTLME